MLVAWVVFPLVLALLSLGCGLLLAQAAAVRLPAALLLPAGFTVFSLTTQFATLSDATASLATPAVVALALTGFGLSSSRRVRGFNPWLAAAAAGVFAVYAAPTVLTGRATFLGYIKLDDTATYLAMLDRAVTHGYDVGGLASSTYEATLKTSLALGYPLGSLMPLGVGSALVGEDAAWLWQPYLAFLGVLISVGLYQLVAGVVRSDWLRALVAFVGAQAALIFGYALWGGIKELATAAIVVLAAALVPRTATDRARARTVLPLAAACAALVSVLSVGGAAWLAPLLAGALVLALLAAGVRPAVRLALAFVVGAAAFAVPAFVRAAEWLSHASAFTGGDEYGNLSGRLDWLQVFGIWLNGDFRRPPPSLDVTHVLVAVAGLAAAAAAAVAWRRKTWELPLALCTAAVSCLVYVGAGSPWIGGKALASASPIVLAAAMTTAAALFESGRRTEGVALGGVLIAAVVWSNVLQYREVFVAPSERLSELASIGHRFAGDGPTLLTEFDAYGARHFLRELDTEAAAELRRHVVYLRGRDVAEFGVSPDVDEIRFDQVLQYRTLVLRRSGLTSRPPSTYSLASSGRYYTVWQRADARSVIEHISLGSRLQPAAVPPCREVLRLGRLARASNGVLAFVRRPPAIVIDTDGSLRVPTSFGQYGEHGAALYLDDAYSVDATFTAPSAAVYGIWIGGSFRARVHVSIDGDELGSARNELQWPGNFVQVGEARLARRAHTFRLRYDGPDLHPGSAGEAPFGLGPFALADGTEERPVTYVEPSKARSLCGRSLDWVEALRG